MKQSLWGGISAAVVLAMGAVGGGAYAAAPGAQAFVNAASQDGITEVELGRIAQKNGTDPRVRDFGAQMVQDHGKANAELVALAKSKGLVVSSDLDAKHARMIDELKSKSGRDFDVSYARHMSDAHTQAINLFTEASRISDKEISTFATQTLPTLEEHKHMADELVRK